MDRTEGKVVEMWTSKKLPDRVSDDDKLWQSVLNNLIYPTFSTCRSRLDMLRRHSDVNLPVKYTRPFVVLFWTGKEHLENHRIGLQYTYCGDGNIAFDLSVVRFNEASKDQASLYQEYFMASDPDIRTKMLTQCMFGMGMAMTLEDPLSIRKAIWNNSPYERRPTRLC